MAVDLGGYCICASITNAKYFDIFLSTAKIEIEVSDFPQVSQSKPNIFNLPNPF